MKLVSSWFIVIGPKMLLHHYLCVGDGLMFTCLYENEPSKETIFLI